jgi:hypothetical protein
MGEEAPLVPEYGISGAFSFAFASNENYIVDEVNSIAHSSDL